MNTAIAPLTRMENLVVAKLWQRDAQNLGKSELDRIFFSVGRPDYCKNVVRQLIERGMTIDTLYSLYPAAYVTSYADTN